MMAAMLTLILTGLLRGVRTQHALVLENLALRHQLAVLQRTAPRPRLRPSDRVFWVLLARSVARLGGGRRHRPTRDRHPVAADRLQACSGPGKAAGPGPGHPAVAPDVRALIRTMARANPLWGAPRDPRRVLQKLRPRDLAGHGLQVPGPPSNALHRRRGARSSTTTLGSLVSVGKFLHRALRVLFKRFCSSSVVSGRY